MLLLIKFKTTFTLKNTKNEEEIEEAHEKEIQSSKLTRKILMV